MTKNSNLFILFFLGVIWSSFAAFTKISGENLSPFFVSFSRLALAAIMLYAICIVQKKRIFIKNNIKHYFIVGFFNSALPFTLFAIALRYMDSGTASILDGTVPMFEVLISILILKKSVDKNSIYGVIFGLVGIIITYSDGIASAKPTLSYSLAVIATLAATASYASAALYINNKCKNIDSMTMALGSVTIATLMLSPSLFFTNFGVIDAKVAMSLAGLGLLCTGLAYVLFFKLISEEGPRTAVSVVLLIPVFGTIFGAMFLGETITLNKIIGCVTILVSMKFILNLSKENFFKSKSTPVLK